MSIKTDLVDSNPYLVYSDNPESIYEGGITPTAPHMNCHQVKV